MFKGAPRLHPVGLIASVHFFPPLAFFFYRQSLHPLRGAFPKIRGRGLGQLVAHPSDCPHVVGVFPRGCPRPASTAGSARPLPPPAPPGVPTTGLGWLGSMWVSVYRLISLLFNSTERLLGKVVVRNSVQCFIFDVFNRAFILLECGMGCFNATSVWRAGLF